MRFFKYHALGEDVVIMNRQDVAQVATTDIARIAQHIGGVGAHAIVLRGEPTSDKTPVIEVLGLKGKTLRWGAAWFQCFARFMWDEGEASSGPFEVSWNDQSTLVEVLCEGSSVAVETPAASFLSHDVPVTGPPREIINERLHVGGQVFEFSALNLESPHCLVPRLEWNATEIHRFGPLIETEPQFPSLTNVHFYHCESRDRLKIASWRRDFGYAPCSDLGAAACLLAAHRRDVAEREVVIATDNGELTASIEANQQVRLAAKVRKIADGVVCPELFAS